MSFTPITFSHILVWPFKSHSDGGLRASSCASPESKTYRRACTIITVTLTLSNINFSHKHVVLCHEIWFITPYHISLIGILPSYLNYFSYFYSPRPFPPFSPNLCLKMLSNLNSFSNDSKWYRQHENRMKSVHDKSNAFHFRLSSNCNLTLTFYLIFNYWSAHIG